METTTKWTEVFILTFFVTPEAAPVNEKPIPAQTATRAPLKVVAAFISTKPVFRWHGAGRSA